MSASGDNGGVRERFRLQFQQRLREYLARNGSPGDGFNLVWDRTAEECPLTEPDQMALHWELVQWARSYDLFTCGDPKSTLGNTDI